MQLYEIATHGLRVDLTLVATRISLLHVLDLEDPLVFGPVVDGTEAHVRRVRVSTHGQDVEVVMPDP